MTITKNESNIAKLLTLPQIFDGRCFSIPDYQRGYSWEKSHVQALLDDIELLHDRSYLHYTGTVVICKSNNSVNNTISQDKHFEIIDGQQRLTTVTILLAVLRGHCKNESLKDEIWRLYLKRGEEGNYYRVFSLNNAGNDFYEALVINDKENIAAPEFLAQKNIKVAHNTIKKWCEKLVEGNVSAESIINTVTKKLGFIVYEPESDAESGMMFVVINNRGKPLTELEKVKNYLIYYAIKHNVNDLRRTVDRVWLTILKNLALAHNLNKPDENTFLKAATICFFGFNKDESTNIYQQLKHKFPIAGDNRWKKLKAFVEFLESCSFYYEILLNDNSYERIRLGHKTVVNFIELIRSQTTFANILPVYFALMSHRDRIDQENLIDAFRMIEILNFRVYMTRNGAKRSDTGQGQLFRIAHGFYSKFHNNEWLNQQNEAIKSLYEDEFEYKSTVGALIGNLYDIVQEYADDTKFKQGLILSKEDKDDFYDWRGIRYFFLNFEQEVNNKRTIKVEQILKKRKSGKSNDYYSVEHIWARANQVKGRKTKDDKSNFHKRRLGNFVLLELGINIQAKDADIEDKIKIYTGENKSLDSTNQKQVQLLIQDFYAEKEVQDKKVAKRARKKTINYRRDLNFGTIDRFENRLVKFAVTRWDINWAEKYWED